MSLKAMPDRPYDIGVTDASVQHICCDCVDLPLEDDSVDLVFGSPPYEDARTYGIDFKAKGEAWVDWALPRFIEHLRVCRGLVAWVVEGRTRQFRYSPVVMRLMCRLDDAGYLLRKPPIYKRVGIPGSGGPDWLRNDYELIVCATKRGKLPWSDNTAMGHPPKCPPGGRPSHQTRDGRVNKPRLQREGDVRRVREYKPPVKANPGNIIACHGGGGHMGHPLAHENEAPFSQELADFFVRSFCPRSGTVLDPFGGSGTTAAASIAAGRRCVNVDIRESQIDLAKRRTQDSDDEP